MNINNATGEVSVDQTLLMNNSLHGFESAEENMLIMDKVMGTLDQIVHQLDDMNKNLVNVESRINNLEIIKNNNNSITK